MGTPVDAVINALCEVLADAEARDDEESWNVETINRWIDQLPVSRRGQFDGLKLRAAFGYVDRADAIGHLRATIKYLVVNGANLEPRRWWQLKRRRMASKPIDVEFKMIEAPTELPIKIVEFED